MLLSVRKIFLSNFVLRRKISSLFISSKERLQYDTTIVFNQILRNPINGKSNLTRCYSNQSGGRFNSKFLNSLERFADRMYARYLWLRYEGTLGPPKDPQSFSVKQKRKMNRINFIILFVFAIVCFISYDTDSSRTNPYIVFLKTWPDNLEEYRDLLNESHGIKSSKSSPPPPSSPPSAPVSTPVTSSPLTT